MALAQPRVAVGGSYISEEVARSVDAEVRRLIEAAGERAGRLLAGSRAQLDAVAGALLERETLTGEELEALLNPARRRRPDR